MMRIKNKWRELTSSSSIFGLTRISSTKNLFIKIFWVLSSFSFLSLGLYLTFNTIQSFLEYPVITNIQRTQTMPVIFPAIVICGENLSLIDIAFDSNTFQNKFLDTSDFEEFSDLYYSWTCIRFNGYRNESVELKTVNGTDFDENALSIYISEVSGSRFFAFVTPNTLNAFNSRSQISLSAGKQHNLHVTKSIEKKLPKPYNRCLNESESYHKGDCLEQCVERKVTDKYNCSFGGYYQNRNFERCIDLDVFYLDLDEFPAFKADCQSECVDGCYTLTYLFTLSEDTPIDISTLSLTVVFSDLTYNEITQIPKMTVFDLIGSIGGTLGVFIGFQIMSLMEIFQFFFDIFFILIGK